MYCLPVQLVTSTSLDRERQDHYALVVTCWDAGRPPLSSVAHVPVRVLDANDNRPRFAATTYTARLSENNRPGVEVVRVVAADADLGLNAELHYVLADGVPDGAFDVDRADGTVRALASVRYSVSALSRFLCLRPFCQWDRRHYEQLYSSASDREKQTNRKQYTINTKIQSISQSIN